MKRERPLREAKWEKKFKLTCTKVGVIMGGKMV